MDKSARNMAVVASGAAVAAWVFGVLSFSKMVVVAGLLGGGVVVYQYWERGVETLDTGPNVATKDALTEPELRDRIIEWSKTYPAQGTVAFLPNDTKADSVPLYWEDDQADPEELWYFYTSSGFNNQPIVVYIEAMTGRVTGHKQFRDLDAAKTIEEQPFKYSDRYNEYVNDRKSKTLRYRSHRSTRNNSNDSGNDEPSVNPDTEMPASAGS